MDYSKNSKGGYMKITTEITGDESIMSQYPSIATVEIASTKDYYYFHNDDIEFYSNDAYQISVVEAHKIVYLGLSTTDQIDHNKMVEAQLLQSQMLDHAYVTDCDNTMVILGFSDDHKELKYIKEMIVKIANGYISSITLNYDQGQNIDQIKLTYEDVKEDYKHELDTYAVYSALENENKLSTIYKDYRIIDQRKIKDIVKSSN